ncbi:MAG: carbamate kinase [Candidatus Geothermarchaeales archaeon]
MKQNAGRVVVALGGNAIKEADERGTVEEQLRNVKTTCDQIVKIIEQGYEAVITHGNGPQAGNLLIQQEEAVSLVPSQPLDVVVAMTQGQIGYMFQQTLRNTLGERGVKKQVVTVVTQVLVDRDDPDFSDPSKPVGPFYDEPTAERLAKEKGYVIKKVRPTGERSFRRVVPSPDPKEMVEAHVIRRLVDEGLIVIASGGGAVPIVSVDEGLRGIEAVVDKDLAGQHLATAVEADTLLILTDIDSVKLDFGKATEREVRRMTVEEAERYLNEGHFLEGSMKPKVLACIRFLKSGGRRAVIGSLDRGLEALRGEVGTLITG